jgi:hypothetical protein
MTLLEGPPEPSTDPKPAAETASPETPPAKESPAKTKPRLERWMKPESRSRRLILALVLYLICASVFATVAGSTRLTEHTQFNHFALLADAWLHGRQDLAHGAPAYAQNNDFAVFEGKTYISFPPFPALLMLPLVKLAGSPENFRDGQFIIWLAGLGPSLLFLVLEQLRRTGRSPRSERENLVFSGIFAFGTVYFFTAVEGTVWYAAQVVGVGLMGFFLLFALDARRPLLAGAMMGLAYLTRPSMLLASVFFALEALRVGVEGGLPSQGTIGDKVRETWRRLDKVAFVRRCVVFAVPILLSYAIVAWMNWSRYARPSPFFFDHEYLTVAWHGRIQKWGLLGYHYVAKNLGIAFSSLPWLPPKGGAAMFGSPFKVNEHGLALWFTTPLYLWLLWPKLRPTANGAADATGATGATGASSTSGGERWLYFTALLAAALPALWDLSYQNSGWRQFGYRFSNDYALLLFVMLAVGARPFGWLARIAVTWGIAWNLFGAATFDHGEYDRFYFRDGSQSVVYQPD